MAIEKEGPRGDRQPRYPALWKDRLPIPSRRIGKSPGLRIVVFYDNAYPVLRPVLIYFKGDMPNPPDELLRRVLKELDE